MISATHMAGTHKKRMEDRFGSFFSFDEDSESEDISLDELEEELKEHKNCDVLVTILTNGEKQRGMATLVEGDLGHTEEALIQTHICSISSEIRSLQEKSWDISLKLKNRKVRTSLHSAYHMLTSIISCIFTN